MPLKDYQQEIQLATLYAVAQGQKVGSEQLQANIEVVGGTVNIYGSQLEPDSAPTGMYKTRDGFVGIDSFGVIPNYLYIEQKTGETTSIILSGVRATEVEV